MNNLVHDIIYTGSTGDWSAGTVSVNGYTTMPNSSLSAMYNWCRLCANNTIIAFQDENGFVQIGNHTSRGWNLNQLGPALKPVMGTGLALHYTGEEYQINLFYQKSFLNLSMACFNPKNPDGLSTITPPPRFLLMLKAQSTAGPSTLWFSTPSHRARPSPWRRLIPNFPTTRKPGRKS